MILPYNSHSDSFIYTKPQQATTKTLVNIGFYIGKWLNSYISKAHWSFMCLVIIKQDKSTEKCPWVFWTMLKVLWGAVG